MREEIIKTDILIIGGGIAGLMAAIRAAEMGVGVTVVEKANTLRSGAGAAGNDHFQCYIPEVHGPDISLAIAASAHSPSGNTRPASYYRTFYSKSFDIVKLWDSWGIPMKPLGKWEFIGQALPGKPRFALKYAGQDQKKILTREALKRGVKIVNRVMVFDLLSSKNGLGGAIGIGAREEKMVSFLAKAVFLGTGRCVRLYPSGTPAWMFNRAECPANTGDGRAMAFRAGAELSDIELPQRWAGPRYFLRCGKGTWIGVVRTPDGKPVGPYVSQPDRLHGDPIASLNHGMFEEFEKQGNAPVYMDCRGMSDEDYDLLRWGLSNEGNTAILNYFKEEGIDLRKNPVEFMTYEITTRGGLKFNERGETSLKGLYAAGDEYFNGIGSAAVFGYISGENAAKYAKNQEMPEKADWQTGVEERMEFIKRGDSRKGGASWQEANIALNQMMHTYLGPTLTQTMMEAGQSHLKRLRNKVLEGLVFHNQHELMHGLEVINLIDIGEIMFATSLARQESRGEFQRKDYPFTNVLLNNKKLVCKKDANTLVTEWKDEIK